MRSCERASEITSASLDRRLTPTEFIGLWIHRAVCGPCRVYRRQMLMLRERVRNLENEPAGDARLETSAKDRIRERLRAESAAKAPD